MTIREEIETIQKRLKEDLNPTQATVLLNTLSSLLGSVTVHLTDAQMNYNLKLSELVENESAAKAKIKAEATDQYRQLMTVKAYAQLVDSMISSLKYTIKVGLEDYKNTRYQ